jgi:molybdenum cofactor cytidylyltransferase
MVLFTQEVSFMHTVLLAAGKSSRMGDIKLLLPYRDKPLICHAIEAALAGSDYVIVVTGFYEKAIIPILEQYQTQFPYRLTWVQNPHPQFGQFSSTLVGVSHIPETESFAIALGDAPLITAYHYHQLQQLLPSYEAVRPFCNNIPGHPVLCAPSLLPVILAQPKTATMRALLASRAVREFITEDQAWITDIDTPEAYQKLIDLSCVDSET